MTPAKMSIRRQDIDTLSIHGLRPEILDEIVHVIREHGDPSSIILYGSRTRGDFDEQSDIDIAVDGHVDPLLARGYLEEEVRTLKRFDVVHVDDLDAEMLTSINREGVILYDKAHEPSRQS